MKNMIKVSTLVAAVLALANTGAWGLSTSTSISLQADVQSSDNISCTGGTVSFASGNVIAGTAATPATQPTCTITDNDLNGDTLTVYISTAQAFTGTTNTTTYLPSSDLKVYASGNANADSVSPIYAYSAFTALGSTFVGSGGLSGDSGLNLGTFPPDLDSYTANINLQLTVAAATAADTYDGTLYVVITPAS